MSEREARATKKQQELLSFIDRFIAEQGYGPSYREAMSGLGYKSVSTVAAHVDGLIAKGYLRRGDGGARALEVVDRHQSPEETPTQTLARIGSLVKAAEDIDDRRALLRTLELLGEHDMAARLKGK